MSRSKYALVCVVVVVAAGLVPIVGAELPEHDDEIYVWSVDDPADDAAGGSLPGSVGNIERMFAQAACALMSGSDAQDSPCQGLGYTIGHTDTHIFFRWQMATLEWDSSGEDFEVLFTSSFRGDHPENDNFKRSFSIALRVNSEEAVVEHAEAQVAPDEYEDWTEDVLVGIDREAGLLTSALPLELLETRVDPVGDTLVGQSFNVTKPPQASVINTACPDHGGDLPECLSWMKGFDADDIPDASAGENATYRIHPVGSLKPRVIENDVSSNTFTIDLSFPRAAWESHEYLWDASGFDGFEIGHEVELENGTVTILVAGPDGAEYYNVTLDETGDDSDTLEDLEPGEWTVRVDLADWVEGNVIVHLEGIEIVVENENGGGGGNGGGSENETDDQEVDPDNLTDDGGVDDQESPAPGIVLVVLATLAGVQVLRRRR